MVKKSCVTIFSESEEHKDYDSLAKKLKKKRVHYKNTTYTKYYKNDIIDGNYTQNDTHTWGRLNCMYAYLSDFFPVFFNDSLGRLLNTGTLYYEDEETVVYDIGLIRSWRNRYTEEEYEYKGRDGWGVFKGQSFEVTGAEIIGSEDLLLDSRLFLHTWLFEFLQEGYRIEQLNPWIEELLNYINQGITAQCIVLAMLVIGDVKNPPNLDGKEDFMT